MNDGLNSLGEPAVNFDQLDELFRREFGLPEDITPSIDLQGLSDRFRKLGQYRPYSHHIKINALATERQYGRDATMKVVLHEGEHLAHAKTHPYKFTGEYALQLAVYGSGLFIADKIVTHEPGIYGYIGGVSAFLMTRTAYYKIDPIEARARKIQRNEELIEKYRDAIVFSPPNSTTREIV